MSEKNLRLEIVTPQKKVFSEDVSFLVAPGTDGELGILPEHAPLITSLNIGVLRIEQEGKKFKVVVSGGFMEVRNNKTRNFFNRNSLTCEISRKHILKIRSWIGTNE